MESVLTPGTCAASMQTDYDEEVAFQATRKLYEIARHHADQPFFLFVSGAAPGALHALGPPAHVDAATRYVRNRGDLYELQRRARIASAADRAQAASSSNVHSAARRVV